MIVHRDYRSSSDSIIKIYDNKIEFYNPGRLPSTISVEDLISNNYKSTPRNKLIADFCKSLGLIEKYGSGIQWIIESFKNANLPAPEFRNISEGFMVTVFSGDKLGDNQKKILHLIEEDPYISLSQLSKSIGISQTAIEKNIKRLKESGLLRRIGSAKGGYWEVMNNDV